MSVLTDFWPSNDGGAILVILRDPVSAVSIITGNGEQISEFNKELVIDFL